MTRLVPCGSYEGCEVTVSLIARVAKDVADLYCLDENHRWSWDRWGVNAREDFWEQAQMILGVPIEEWEPLPDEYAKKE